MLVETTEEIVDAAIANAETVEDVRHTLEATPDAHEYLQERVQADRDEHVTTKADVKRNRETYFSAQRRERAYQQLPLHTRLRTKLPDRFGGIEHSLKDGPSADDIDGPGRSRRSRGLCNSHQRPNNAPTAISSSTSDFLPPKRPLTPLSKRLKRVRRCVESSEPRPAHTRISCMRSTPPMRTRKTNPRKTGPTYWNKRISASERASTPSAEIHQWVCDTRVVAGGVHNSTASLLVDRETGSGAVGRGYAVEQVDERAEFTQADLGEPLDFLVTDSFDGIVSALALSYVKDWDQVFSEFNRILTSGGFLVFSTGHPLNQYPPENDEGGNYFEVEELSKEWEVDVPYYRRPFSEILTPVLENGFQLDTTVEPQPTEAFKELRPERYEKESRYPVFLCVRTTKQYTPPNRISPYSIAVRGIGCDPSYLTNYE